MHQKSSDEHNLLVTKDINNLHEYTNHKESVETFLNQLPCSIFRCLNNQFYTIEFSNINFLELSGYSSKEFKEFFNNHFIEIVHEDDRSNLFKRVENQLKESDTYEIEYRIIHKNGSVVWIRDKGNKLVNHNGIEYFYCCVSDITYEKVNDEQIEINENYYRAIMEKSGESLYVIDTERDKVFYSENLIDKFGSRISKFKNIYSILNSDFIYSDDIKICNKMIKDITHTYSSNDNYNELEIRIKNTKNEYIWCLVKFYVLRDIYKKVTKVIGVITDIDEAKKEHKNLHKMAERDLLTGLYNKVTSQNLIEDYINREEGNKAALFIIDLDNFKDINDNLGHLFGDGVLIEVAREIKSLFRKDDIVGRIGGDEFIVFMKSIKSKDIIAKKAKLLNKILKRSYKGTNNEYTISGSIGISLFPNSGGTFPKMFQKADAAAYYCKQEGKNCYKIYDNNIGEIKYVNTSRKEISEIDSEKAKENNFPRYIFEILYETSDIDVAMDRILNLTARYYNISNVYIFEHVEDDGILKKTYEYQREGSLLVKEQSLIYDSLNHDDYMKLYDLNGVFYCNDIERLPEDVYKVYKQYKVSSVLQSLIMEDGVFKGVIGFIEEGSKRLWSQGEIDANVFISRIISIFLLKKRKENQLIKLNNLFQFMLENTTTFNYIIDKETYKVVYANEKTKQLYKNLRLGEECYKCIRGNGNVCDDCPTRKLVNGIKKVENNFYNDENSLDISGIALLAKWVDDRDVYIFLQSIENDNKKDI